MSALAHLEPPRTAPLAAVKHPANAPDNEAIRWVQRRLAFERWLDDVRDTASRPRLAPASPLAP